MRSRGVLTFAIGEAYTRAAHGLYLSTLLQKDVGFVAIVKPDAREDIAYLTKNNVPYTELSNRHEVKGRFWFEQAAFKVSPFQLTLKMDADCLLPNGSSLNYAFMRILEQGLVNGSPHTLLGNKFSPTAYRSGENERGLPSVYSTMFGFDKSKESKQFFQVLKSVYKNWDTDALQVSKGIELTTDSAYSIAWSICNPNNDAVSGGIPFHHMKPSALGWTDTSDAWTSSVPHHIDDAGRVFVAGIRVGLPMHYFDKRFLSKAYLDQLKELAGHVRNS